MNRFLSRTLVAVLVIGFGASAANADQFRARHHGREIVVHTNPIPVFFHRLVPPNYGRHVTLREYRSGKVPTPSQASPINAISVLATPNP